MTIGIQRRDVIANRPSSAKGSTGRSAAAWRYGARYRALGVRRTTTSSLVASPGPALPAFLVARKSVPPSPATTSPIRPNIPARRLPSRTGSVRMTTPSASFSGMATKARAGWCWLSGIRWNSRPPDSKPSAGLDAKRRASGPGNAGGRPFRHGSEHGLAAGAREEGPQGAGRGVPVERDRVRHDAGKACPFERHAAIVAEPQHGGLRRARGGFAGKLDA